MEPSISLLSDNDCKAIISKLCKKLCVRPLLVIERLLSIQDKQDMRDGNLSIEALEANIKSWLKNGMPDYAHGKTEPYATEQKRLTREKPFKREDPQEIAYRLPFSSNEI